ncbi:DUF4337 domain-containing protein [Pedobacter nutrimenti]|jgi:hypothetical protein|uniref:Uncharacterized protein DUF4337 n=1 Tax=Pedobacter nutrimenti TaxID=1241337 RepID=A0A318UQN6_9SPHI|nr:DUF4337 domain-containing protein [Pedobacter nutrimenti]PYF77388.1 uncharacterized protein DUF4337 [Pedobacter nutrimenti]
MEDIEVPTEHLHETIKEKTEEARETEKKWVMSLAISTALVAVLAAIAGLLAGHHSNEALIEQIRASDQWAYYQAKGIKAEIKSLQIGGADHSADVEKYRKEQKQIQTAARAHEKLSEDHLEKHVLLAKSVTLFQITIAVSAISILTRRKWLWYLGLVFALFGVFCFISGLL